MYAKSLEVAPTGDLNLQHDLYWASMTFISKVIGRANRHTRQNDCSLAQFEI